MAGGSFFSRFTKKTVNAFVTVVSPSQSNFADLFSTRGNVTASQLIANWETVPSLFTVENYLSDKCASIPVKVVKPSGRESKNSPIWPLIDDPNPHQSWRELIKQFFIYHGITGNAYLYGVKADGLDGYSSLYCLPVEKVEVILSLSKSLPHWMNEVAGYKVNIGGKYYTLPTDAVLHEKQVSLRYDDGSWVYGMSKYIPGDVNIRELKAIHNAKTSIIENRGALGFVTNESEVPDADRSKEVKEKLSRSYGLQDDQDKIIVTTEKLRWQQMALGIQELQLIENAKFTFDEICQMNGISPIIFNSAGAPYANQKDASKDVMTKVIKPRVESFYQSLSAFLNDYLAGDQIVPDWSQVEEMQDDRKIMTDLVTRQIESSIITPKEGREQLYPGLDEREDTPDKFMRKSALVPFDEPVTAPMQMSNSNNSENTDEPDKENEDGNGQE